MAAGCRASGCTVALEKKRFLIFGKRGLRWRKPVYRFPGRLPASVFFARSEIRPVQMLLAKEAMPDCKTKIVLGNALIGK